MPTISMLTVHDKQLVDDIPVEKLLVHDVPVDIICTPTQVIFTKTTIPKPQGSEIFVCSDFLCELVLCDQMLEKFISRDLLGKVISRKIGPNPNSKRA